MGHLGCCFRCRNLMVDYLWGCTFPNFKGGPLRWLYSLLNLNGGALRLLFSLPKFKGGLLMWLHVANFNGSLVVAVYVVNFLLPRQRCQIPRRKHRNVKPHYLWKFGIFGVLLVQLRLVYVGRKVGSPADPSPLPPLIKGWPAKTNTEFWKPDTELLVQIKKIIRKLYI